MAPVARNRDDGKSEADLIWLALIALRSAVEAGIKSQQEGDMRRKPPLHDSNSVPVLAGPIIVIAGKCASTIISHCASNSATTRRSAGNVLLNLLLNSPQERYPIPRAVACLE